jgi:Ca2+-binding EF-hand superfamily protein
MGSGASSEGLGDEELKSLMQNVDDLSAVLGKAHREILRTEIGNVLKNHRAIIGTLSAHTKSGLRKYILLEEDGGLKASDLASLGGDGNPYSDWLGRLPCTEHELNVRDIKLAIDGGFGINLDSIVYTLLTATNVPGLLQELRESSGISLSEVISKIVPNPIVNIFIDSLLAGIHNGKEISAQDAVGILTNESTAEGDFVSLLVQLGFDQLEEVKNILQSSEAGTLEAAIDKRFKAGPLRNYMRVCVQPTMSSAVAEALLQQRSNVKLCVDMLSRFESSFLKEVDASVEIVSGQNMIDLLSGSCLKGNLLDAITAWITSQVPEKTAEENIQVYINDCVELKGMTMGEVFTKEDTCNVIKGLFHDLVAALEKASAVGAAPESPHVAPEDSNVEDGAQGANVRVLSPKSSRLDLKSIVSGDDDSFNDKLTMVTDYLLKIFAAFDPDGRGALPHEKFWSVFADLEIAKLVYTSEEIQEMWELMEYSSSDGFIYWEDVMSEMADGIISGMLRNGINCRKFVEEHLAAARDQLVAELENTQSYLDANSSEIPQENTFAAPTMAPDLMSYLERTFNAFDVDNKGYLTRDDFWNLMQLLNLGLANTGPELDALMTKFDTQPDGMIEWREALPQFDAIIHDLVSDQKDHFIGLEDTDTTYCYWYNLLDGSSQWMTDEESEAYKAHRVDAVPLAGPAKKTIEANKLGVMYSIQHLKKQLMTRAARKEEVEKNPSLDATQKSAIIEKIDVDFSENLQKLKEQHAKAKEHLDQSLGYDRDAKKQLLQNRLLEKKKKKNVA